MHVVHEQREHKLSSGIKWWTYRTYPVMAVCLFIRLPSPPPLPHLPQRLALSNLTAVLSSSHRTPSSRFLGLWIRANRARCCDWLIMATHKETRTRLVFTKYAPVASS